MQLTFDEIIDILDIKNNPTKITGYTLPPGAFEVSDIDLMLKSLLPNDVKISITTDNIRLKSNLKVIKLQYLLINPFLCHIWVYLITSSALKRY